MVFSIVYGRASADPSDQRISVDRQIKLCTARAEELWPGAEVRVFRDDAITAADPNTYRPGFAAFLTAIRSARKGDIAGVVVNEQSRLTRQGTGAWDELVVTLTMAGVTKVETLRAGAVSVEPGNRLVGRILAVIDAEEVERTKARVQDAHRELFKEGRPSGRAPFGYRSTRVCPGSPHCDANDDGRPHRVADPVEAPWVPQVFAWLLEGHAVSVIIERLDAAGVAPRSARWKFSDNRNAATGWKPTAVRSLLTSPSVAGLRGHIDADGVLHTVPARWEPLVDFDVWQRAQQVLGQPTTVTGLNGETYRVRTMPAPRPRRYLLSGGQRRGIAGQPGEAYGVLRCGKCGSPLVAQTQGRRGGERVPAYQCHPKGGQLKACGGVSISPADAVEAFVVTLVQAELAASPLLRARLNGTQNADTDRWRLERDAAKARMLVASQLLGAGDIDRDEFDAMRSPAKADYDAAQARLATTTSDVDLPSMDDVIDRWDTLTLVQQRAVIDRLIERIDVAPSQRGHPGFDEQRLSAPIWRA